MVCFVLHSVLRWGVGQVPCCVVFHFVRRSTGIITGVVPRTVLRVVSRRFFIRALPCEVQAWVYLGTLHGDARAIAIGGVLRIVNFVLRIVK